MSKETGSNYVGLFFSGIAGISGILASLSPFFSSEGGISTLFIDQSVVQFASLLSLIVLILTIWFFNSLSAFMIFGKSFWTLDFIKLLSIVFFPIFALVIYLTKIMYVGGYLNITLASAIQIYAYVLAFFVLGVAVGSTIATALQSIKTDTENATRVDRIIRVLIKHNVINIDIKIKSIIPHNNPEWTFQVIYELTEGSVTKEYLAVFYGDFTKLIQVNEIPPTLASSPQSV